MCLIYVIVNADFRLLIRVLLENFDWNSMKEIIRFLVGLAAPFILIFGGAGLVGIGVEYDIDILGYAGAIITVCGLLWGCWLWLLGSSMSWWD